MDDQHRITAILTSYSHVVTMDDYTTVCYNVPKDDQLTLLHNPAANPCLLELTLRVQIRLCKSSFIAPELTAHCDLHPELLI